MVCIYNKVLLIYKSESCIVTSYMPCWKMADEQFDSYRDSRESLPSYRHGPEEDR